VLQGHRRAYVLRFGATGAAAAVDRARELRLQRAAARHGLAPLPLYADCRRQLLITPLLCCQAQAPVDLEALAGLLRGIHRLRSPGDPLSSSAQLDDYRRRLPATDACAVLLWQQRALFDAAASTCRSQEVAPRVCHNDLLAANRCRSGDDLLALDWEYAAPGDPFFDLAVCASELSGAEADALLECYLGRAASPAEAARFAAQSLIYAGIDACWWRLYGRGNSAAADASLVRLRRACAGAREP
jgi:aminoglycoside phosphotransferase (APT) family kinase protein